MQRGSFEALLVLKGQYNGLQFAVFFALENCKFIAYLFLLYGFILFI